MAQQVGHNVDPAIAGLETRLEGLSRNMSLEQWQHVRSGQLTPDEEVSPLFQAARSVFVELQSATHH